MQEHSNRHLPLLRCRLRRHREGETNPLFLAISNNDLAAVKAFIESGMSANTKNSRGHTPLTIAIYNRREAIFDYLLSLDDVDIEARVQFHRTPLLLTAVIDAPACFAQKLISKGADIRARDDSDFTYLHLAARNRGGDSLEVGKTVIEMGADVDARTSYGLTPLYIACEEGNFEWVLMLLYYGADATIPSAKGMLPLAAVSFIPLEQEAQLQDILFGYTFDGLDNSVRLPTLAQAMTLDSALFDAIVASEPEVVYDDLDLEHLSSVFVHLNPGQFAVFVEKYGHIVEELIEECSPLAILLGFKVDLHPTWVRQMLRVFLESDFVDLFVQTAEPPFCAVSNLVQMFNSCEIDVAEEEVEEVVLLMVSHGLKVFSEDLDAIYTYYGCCELFKILLHTDIEIIHKGELSMAALYYDVNIILESEIDVYDPALLSYFNDAVLKERCLKDPSCVASVKEMVEKLPLVPSLIELSRNMARKYIVNRFNVKNSMQFYTIVKWLPIGEMTKLIITLDKELY